MSPLPPFSYSFPNFRFFLVFHYFRVKALHSFLKSFQQSRLTFLFPSILRFSPYRGSPALMGSLVGFSFLVPLPTPPEALRFSKTLEFHPRAGFVLFYCFDGKIFFPSDLLRILPLYHDSSNAGAVVVKPFYFLALSNQMGFYSFFFSPFFKFFSLISKRPL